MQKALTSRMELPNDSLVSDQATAGLRPAQRQETHQGVRPPGSIFLTLLDRRQHRGDPFPVRVFSIRFLRLLSCPFDINLSTK